MKIASSCLTSMGLPGLIELPEELRFIPAMECHREVPERSWGHFGIGKQAVLQSVILPDLGSTPDRSPTGGKDRVLMLKGVYY